MKVLVTGAAGFIGFHVVQRLIDDGFEVVGLDNINDYYDPQLKYDRLSELGLVRSEIVENKIVVSNRNRSLSFVKGDLCDSSLINDLFAKYEFEYVCHLAAQAGVRYSLENPHLYVSSNITGFLNIIEACRLHHVKHLIFASSSSVYGLNKKMPFSTTDYTDHPVSLYAATKKSNELMAHTYSHLFRIPMTGMRFFTVYGPWGRPDMALYKFTDAILKGEEIEVFNEGKMTRDFTYIDDVVEGVVRILLSPAEPTENWSDNTPDGSSAPYRIYNIGNSHPEQLLSYINAIELAAQIKANIKYKPLQPGDVINTYSDSNPLSEIFGFRPSITIENGVAKFVEWFKGYYTNEKGN